MTQSGDDSRWVVHSERPVYESEWVTVGLADISVPSGERFEHHTVRFPAAAMTLVFDDNGDNVLLSWRHRFAPDVWNWELPGGIVEQDEDPQETAIREVAEETGYKPRTIEHILTFEPAVGMLRNPNHVFIAQGAEYIGTPSEEDEGTFQWIPFNTMPELIAKGHIVNSGTLIAVLHAMAIGHR